jgi:hypothetical protein
MRVLVESAKVGERLSEGRSVGRVLGHYLAPEGGCWINRVLRDGILAAEEEGQYCDPPESKELIARLRGSKSVRNRAMAILAHLRGVSDHMWLAMARLDP